MNSNFRKIDKISFELCVFPDSLAVEFLDESGEAFMNVTYDEHKNYTINFYKSDEHVSVPLSKIDEGIAMLKRNIQT